LTAQSPSKPNWHDIEDHAAKVDARNIMRSNGSPPYNVSKRRIVDSFREPDTGCITAQTLASKSFKLADKKVSRRKNMQDYSGQVSKFFKQYEYCKVKVCEPLARRHEDGLPSLNDKSSNRDIVARRYAEGNRLMDESKLMVNKNGSLEPVEDESDIKINIEKERAEKLLQFKLNRQSHDYLRKVIVLRKDNAIYKSCDPEALMAKTKAVDERIGEMERCQERGKSYRTYYGSSLLIRKHQVCS
jgi:hypothetical protein